MARLEFDDLGEVVIKRTSEKAVLVTLTDWDGSDHWVPLSVLSTPTRDEVEDHPSGVNIQQDLGFFYVEKWWAEKNLQ